MNISQLYRPINELEIKSLQDAQQIFSDCYLVATLNSLSRTNKGQKILKQNIQKSIYPDYPEYKIHFPSINKKAEDIFVSQKEINNLTLSDKYGNPVMHDIKENPTLKAVEIAMNKLIAKHPALKSLINRIPESVENFEYNSPHRFMKIFTGKTPRSINECTWRNSLQSSTAEAKIVLNLISESEKQHNFIAGTGYFVRHPNLETWHCYVITDVNLKNDKITLYNQKKKQTFQMSIMTFLKKFKFITGFLPKDLGK